MKKKEQSTSAMTWSRELGSIRIRAGRRYEKKDPLKYRNERVSARTPRNDEYRHSILGVSEDRYTTGPVRYSIILVLWQVRNALLLARHFGCPQGVLVAVILGVCQDKATQEAAKRTPRTGQYELVRELERA